MDLPSGKKWRPVKLTSNPGGRRGSPFFENDSSRKVLQLLWLFSLCICTTIPYYVTVVEWWKNIGIIKRKLSNYKTLICDRCYMIFPSKMLVNHNTQEIKTGHLFNSSTQKYDFRSRRMFSSRMEEHAFGFLKVQVKLVPRLPVITIIQSRR